MPLRRRPDHELPASHALRVAELVARWNVSHETLLAELGLSSRELSEPGARLPLGVFERLIARACELTGEPGIGFHLGLAMRISAYGYVGFAAMTAADLRGALELACRFAPTVTTAIALRLEVEEMTASLVVEEIGSLGAARETMIISLMLGLWRIGCFITGVELEGRAEFAFLKPLYFSRFAALAPGNVAFSMPVHRLSFDARLLERPLLLSDPSALRLARAQCERELDALHQHGDLVARMQSLVFRQDGGQPKLGELAHQSHTSVRTLERKLRDQGTSYSKLRDQARRSTALDLLSTELSVEEIAARLGYSDAANFTRAFRRWTGQSPRAHRAARRNAESGSQPGDRGAK